VWIRLKREIQCPNESSYKLFYNLLWLWHIGTLITWLETRFGPTNLWLRTQYWLPLFKSQGFKLPKRAFGKPKDLLPKSPLNPPRNDYCQIRYKLCTICFADYDRQTNDCSILHVPSSDDGRCLLESMDHSMPCAVAPT